MYNNSLVSFSCLQISFLWTTKQNFNPIPVESCLFITKRTTYILSCYTKLYRNSYKKFLYTGLDQKGSNNMDGSVALGSTEWLTYEVSNPVPCSVSMVGLTGIVRNLIQKSMGMDRPFFSLESSSR